MANNKPVRDYWGIDFLVDKIVAGMTGFQGWFLGIFLKFLLRRLAREGVYLIDVASANIATNMDADTWQKVVGETYEQIKDPELTPEMGELIDRRFKLAFDNFVVFKRVKK